MTINRAAFRKEAKKLYKEKNKGVPKKQRLPFSDFFKQYKDMKSGKIDESQLSGSEDSELNSEEDFDFENIINVNEINDDDVETSEIIVKDESQGS